jgi:serine/threonine protein kinase
MMRYQNLWEIGEGGQGKIYLADDVVTNKRVIIKKAKHDNPGSRRRLKREARLLREQADNPFVVNLEADYSDNSPAFIVLEYCSGGSLATWVSNRRPIREVVIAMQHTMWGLQGFHNKRGFHGDVTPNNLQKANDPDGWRIRLIDLGLGQTPNSLSGSMTYSWRGTPNYIAPEVNHGDDYTWRADIYSAGIVFREFLTGFKTKVGSTFNKPPDELTALIDKMTAASPWLRPDTQTIITELTDYLNKPVIQPVTTSSQGSKWGGVLAIAGILALLAKKNDYDSNVGRYRNSKGQFTSGWF